MLADKYHVVAPDFPGYGESSAPSVNDFDYSYERLATVTEKFTEKLNLSSYALYLSDKGASVGFRLAVMHRFLLRYSRIHAALCAGSRYGI